MISASFQQKVGQVDSHIAEVEQVLADVKRTQKEYVKASNRVHDMLAKLNEARQAENKTKEALEKAYVAKGAALDTAMRRLKESFTSQ